MQLTSYLMLLLVWSLQFVSCKVVRQKRQWEGSCDACHKAFSDCQQFPFRSRGDKEHMIRWAQCMKPAFRKWKFQTETNFWPDPEMLMHGPVNSLVSHTDRKLCFHQVRNSDECLMCGLNHPMAALAFEEAAVACREKAKQPQVPITTQRQPPYTPRLQVYRYQNQQAHHDGQRLPSSQVPPQHHQQLNFHENPLPPEGRLAMASSTESFAQSHQLNFLQIRQPPRGRLATASYVSTGSLPQSQKTNMVLLLFLAKPARKPYSLNDGMPAVQPAAQVGQIIPYHAVAPYHANAPRAFMKPVTPNLPVSVSVLPIPSNQAYGNPIVLLLKLPPNQPVHIYRTMDPITAAINWVQSV